MRFVRISSLILVLLHLEACNFGYQKTESGVYYKIIGHAKTPVAVQGEVLKMHVKQRFADSVLRDTRKYIPDYQVLDSTSMSKDAYLIFSKTSIGDSLVFKAAPDTLLIKKFPGNYETMLITTVKILNIFANRDSAIKDQEYEQNRLKLSHNPVGVQRSRFGSKD
jgi:hypothetical protein